MTTTANRDLSVAPARLVVTVNERSHPISERPFFEVETFDLDTLHALSLDRFWVDADAEKHASKLRRRIALNESLLWGVYDNECEEFVEAYPSQREAEDVARGRNDDHLNSYDRYPSDVERFTVDQLPQPWPAWAVRP